MKKKCELCNQSAQIYCQSDNASLCYTCDQTVHSANFLVAKHSRTLLCTNCQSLTPWTASGLNLGQPKTTCSPNCQQSSSSSHFQNDVVQQENDTEYDETDDDETDDEESDDDESDDAENQVVPWSSAISPRVNSCSSSDECRSQMKRCRFHEFNDSSEDDTDIDTDRDTEYSSERSNRKRRTEEIYNRSY